MHRDQACHSRAATLSRAAKPGEAVDGRSSLPCRVFEPELWFADTAADLDAAKRLCAPCPLREECLAGALRRREPWGVWGGEIVADGVVIPHKRRRGRPATRVA